MKSKKILVTGATGNLGAYAAFHFLQHGHTVYAPFRRGNDNSKVMACINRFGVKNNENFKRLNTFEWDICQDPCQHFPNDIDETWHFASSLKYLWSDREEIYNVNINGLENVISYHVKNCRDGAKFYYISTAYVAGKVLSHLAESAIPDNEEMKYTNEYERSKLQAENILLKKISQGILPGNIFRPSIVIGDSVSGQLINYNGFYIAINLLYNLTGTLAKSGRQLKELRLFIDPESHLNLIPLDHAIQMMYTISEKNVPNGQIFNIVNSKSIQTKGVVRIIADLFKLQFRFVEEIAFKEQPGTRDERLVHYALDYVMPYLNKRIIFDTANTDQVLGFRFEYPINDEKILELTNRFIDLLVETKF